MSQIQADNTKKINDMIEFLKGQGVAKEDIETENYNLQPRYEYSSCPPVVYGANKPVVCPPPRISGFTLTQTVSVKLRNLDKAGEILAAIGTKGANSISGLSFTVDDPVKFENEARAKAIAEARVKAEATARAANVKLGKLLSISEYAYPAAGYDAFGGAGKAMSTAPRPQIEPGSEEVVVSVELVYEIR